MTPLVPTPGGATATRAASFFSQLQPASWRGVPFETFGGQAQFGRRTAVHEYPNRDVPWVEDLGRGTRRIQVTAFLVGDDVIAQRDALIAACEKPGPGELVHPTFGKLQVSLVTFSTSEHWERGRFFEANFTFIEGGARQFPGTAVSSAGAIADAAGANDAAADDQWGGDVAEQLAASQPVSIAATPLMQSWTSSALSAVAQATNLMNLATTATGNFGRLLGQATGIVLGVEQAVTKPLNALFGAAAAARTAVSNAAAAARAAAVNLEVGTAATFQETSKAFAQAIQGSAFTPADAISCSVAMLAANGSGSLSSTSTGDYLRRLGISQLAIASSQYQPSTAAEAVAVRTQVVGFIDAEIAIAGAQGNDGVYVAMKALRAQVTLDMNAKGAQLPTLEVVSTPRPMPSLVLAQRLYGDPSREVELVRRAQPIHPAFMPTSFLALSK